MPKITKVDPKSRTVIQAKTSNKADLNSSTYKWWNAGSKKDLSSQMVATAAYLKERQQYRYREAGIFARLYGNMPLMNIAGSQFGKINSITTNLPIDRPTMNVVQSCIDTLVSRITQSRPRPMFLTDDSDYKQRKLAKQLNNFMDGELYQTKAHALGELFLRDAAVLGTGCLKIFENADKRVALDRVLKTELLVDPNDALYGDPRTLYQFKLVDREMLMENFPKYQSQIAAAEQAYPESGGESSETVSDQVMVVEGWRLPTSKDAKDGVHAIACSSGIIFDEDYDRMEFPFVFLHYSPRITGFWGQGLAEQLMGTQVEINKLLMTISQAINLVGVPRVFIEDGSKVVKSHLNNQVGAIVTYRGTKPQYEVAPCIPAEVYAQLQRLVQFAYQQSGVSALAATSQKPAGLNSGEAIRNYDDLQTDRFAALARRYEQAFVSLAYQITNKACAIAERDGKYQTIYPGKNGVQSIDLPATKLLENPFVIQCFDTSSLPRDPSGRMQKVTEMAQAGWINTQEARRLLDFPDLQQEDKLATAAEERILAALDAIIEKGESGYTPPDPDMDLQLALQKTVQYINLYIPAGLEDAKVEKLRTFKTQILDLVKASMPAPQAPGNPAQAVPTAPPVSDLIPNIPTSGA